MLFFGINLAFFFVFLTLYAGCLCLDGAFCSDGDGRITGNDATKFFAMSNLSRQDLKQV
jgi:hypothetical protein